MITAGGVPQIVPDGWYAATERYLGNRACEFLHRTWKDERIERAEEPFAVVEALRRNGYGVHLGMSQERHCGAPMRRVLGPRRRRANANGNGHTASTTSDRRSRP